MANGSSSKCMNEWIEGLAKYSSPSISHKYIYMYIRIENINIKDKNMENVLFRIRL